MTRPKTKRIVWAIAVLLALSIVAVMVWPNHEPPIIIGNISKEDASNVSRAALRQERVALRGLLIAYLHARDIKEFIACARYYSSIRIVRLDVLRDGNVTVTMGCKHNEGYAVWVAFKEHGEWRVADPNDGRPTNTAPVSQRGVGK